jgi:hypothetical protein
MITLTAELNTQYISNGCVRVEFDTFISSRRSCISEVFFDSQDLSILSVSWDISDLIYSSPAIDFDPTNATFGMFTYSQSFAGIAPTVNGITLDSSSSNLRMWDGLGGTPPSEGYAESFVLWNLPRLPEGTNLFGASASIDSSLRATLEIASYSQVDGYSAVINTLSTLFDKRDYGYFSISFSIGEMFGPLEFHEHLSYDITSIKFTQSVYEPPMLLMFVSTIFACYIIRRKRKVDAW